MDTAVKLIKFILVVETSCQMGQIWDTSINSSIDQRENCFVDRASKKNFS